jgi:GNAT superfamily N-acetyltransferase
MDIHIRNATIDDYQSAETIMRQVQQLHIDWRPDIYRHSETVLPADIYEQALRDQTFFVAECGGHVAGIMMILYRHIESTNQVTRDVIFIDSMAVDEPYRGKGIGHAFFDFLKELKRQKGCDGIELQVNARNKAAYQMYVNCGFTEKSINMELL